MSPLPPIEERTLSVAYARVLAHSPDKTAHVGDGRSWTFRESFERATRIGHGLESLGVPRGAPVALLLDSSVDFVHVWTGIGLAGRVEVPVNTANRGTFLSHVLNDSQARVAIIEAAYAERLVAVIDELSDLQTVIVRGERSAAVDELGTRLQVREFEQIVADDVRPLGPVAPHELIAYMYTSGTTGPSKGVLCSHVHAYTYSSREDVARPTADDRFLVTLPMFHLAGQWYGVYMALIHGATCVIEPGFSVTRFWDVVREHDITFTILLGAMAELLQQQPRRDNDAANPLQIASMAPLASDVDGFCERFAIEANSVYGMSEIGAVIGGLADNLVPGQAGFAREGYELRIVDDAGDDVRAGEVVELWVRPEHPLMVLSGYHNLPDKTAETIVDGWVHTGDAMRQGAEGRYFFADRMKDALRRRGENVSSFEVEKVINAHPQVYESAVVAVPSALTEDEIKAVVVPRDGARIDPVELTEFLVERMPYFMVPRYLEYADELPKTPTQKVSKHVLRPRGLQGEVWDREAAGIVLRRDGSRR